VCKPDCEYPVAPLSIEVCNLFAKDPRSVLEVASMFSGVRRRFAESSLSSVLESNELGLFQRVQQRRGQGRTVLSRGESESRR